MKFISVKEEQSDDSLIAVSCSSISDKEFSKDMVRGEMKLYGTQISEHENNKIKLMLKLLRL